MRCSICGAETTELLKGKRTAICYTCVETGRVKCEVPGFVINKQVNCSFCGDETTELTKAPGVAICSSCIETKETEAEIGHNQHCSFCQQMIGTEKGIFGLFGKRTIQAARTGQGAILCNECLPMIKELAGLRHVKWHERVLTALWYLTSRPIIAKF